MILTRILFIIRECLQSRSLGFAAANAGGTGGPGDYQQQKGPDDHSGAGGMRKESIPIAPGKNSQGELTITLTVDVMTICGLRRAIAMNKADLDADTSDAGHGDASVDI
jgi:hypothetical protein